MDWEFPQQPEKPDEWVSEVIWQSQFLGDVRPAEIDGFSLTSPASPEYFGSGNPDAQTTRYT